ncbi:hypothetical protein [Sulfitobacter mediterraneus]|uniref:Uncharacterized protein n=1 Tax=Sulfitobacter mediterraneus TaxID=83219 RepID=A0A2T6CK08_9RHOB|nr:hypothetical protein [Sulfitobacter mediterraneus]PTX75816.1 hypothetical protein C8N31_101477 [Sulfitobacter mediterraneus]
MKLFDPRAELAEIRKQRPTAATPATSATQTAKTHPHVAKVADVAVPRPEISEIPTNDMGHGFAINGHPKTWTGNIVSLDAWRGLSDWERHGPNGRVWCGVCREWIADCEHIKTTKEYGL